MFQSKAFRRFLEAWPGKRTFGIYRFLPFFFVLGAALEFSMINWHAGEVNFCKFWRGAALMMGRLNPLSQK